MITYNNKLSTFYNDRNAKPYLDNDGKVILPIKYHSKIILYQEPNSQKINEKIFKIRLKSAHSYKKIKKENSSPNSSFVQPTSTMKTEEIPSNFQNLKNWHLKFNQLYTRFIQLSQMKNSKK